MKTSTQSARFKRFIKDVSIHTPFSKMVYFLIGSWFLFSFGLYLAERGVEGASIDSVGDGLYWGLAALSGAGIADTPVSGFGQLVGGLWMFFGSVLFFGTLVATVTSYFLRPMQRPHRRIIDTIEYNLEQLDELTLDELDLLKETVDTLIDHVEKLKGK